MPRPNVVPTVQATNAIRHAVGGIPNIYQGVDNSAVALAGVLHIGEVLRKGQLTTVEIEAIKLAVSEAYGWNYCLAAHAMPGKGAGSIEEEDVGIRRAISQKPKIAALVKFVHTAIQAKARLSDTDVRVVKAAGYNDAQLTETLLTLAQAVFTSLFNRVHQTPPDFPPAV